MSGKRVKTSKRYLSDKKVPFNKKIIVAITLILILVAIFCILLINGKTNVEDQPRQIIENTLNDMFVSLKDGNINEINQYIDYEILITSFDPMIVESETDISIDITKRMFKDINWTVEDVDIKGNTAIAIVELTNINFKTIVTIWMKEIVNISSTGVVITNDLALGKLYEILNQENLEFKTIIKKVKLSKENNKWEVELNEDFRDLVYPGIDSVITVLNENESNS